MFTFRQKLVIAGATLFAVLIVVVSYFGSRWFHGPDVEPIPEQVLKAAGRAAPISVSTSNSSLSETDSVSESGDESFSDGDLITDSDSTEVEIDEELEAQLAALSDDDFTALAEALEQDGRESSKYPEVPEGFPVTPVWLKDYFHERDFSNHVRLYRILIELWNRGDRDFISGFSSSKTGKVYPIYPDVVYLKWASYVREGPDGQSIEVPYIKRRLGATDTVNQLVDSDDQLFTEQEILSGAYKTKFPGIYFVDYDDAGYDPAKILSDY